MCELSGKIQPAQWPLSYHNSIKGSTLWASPRQDLIFDLMTAIPSEAAVHIPGSI